MTPGPSLGPAASFVGDGMTRAGIGRSTAWRATNLDLLLALAAFVALLVDPIFGDRSGQVTPLAALLALMAAVPLTCRRRYPLGVLAVEVPALLSCLTVFHPVRAAVAIVMLGVFTVASTGGRLRSLVVGALMAPVVTVAVFVTSKRPGTGDVIAYLALVLGALVAGDAVRARRRIQSLVEEEIDRERAAAAERRFDLERLALAQEVHDVVGHALVGINVRAAGAARLHRHGRSADLPAVLDEIAKTSADALTELRSTLGTLRPAGDQALPLNPVQSLDKLPDLVQAMERAGLNVAATVEGSLEGVPAPVGHVGFRIVQESLTNVMRHSTASRATVKVSAKPTALTVEVSDDGSPEAGEGSEPPGHGVAGMKERARALGGTVDAGPSDDGGWRVRACLPATERSQ